MSKLNRRQLIKLAAVAGAGAFLSHPLKALGSVTEFILEKMTGQTEHVPPPIPGVKFGMVIDMGACIGCRRCSYACKRENNVSDNISPPWIILFETEAKMGVSGYFPHTVKPGEGTTMFYTKLRKDKWYMPVQCNHCDKAPCVRVCPTGASYNAPDGLVLIDYRKCIGCRYCMVACPYHARRFNWWKPEISPERINPLVPIRELGVVEKCTFCVHRTRRGQTTRCVVACPNKARTFGNLNDPDSEVSKLIASERNFRLKEELNTRSRIWYLTRPREKKMLWFSPLPPPEGVKGVRP